MHSRKEVSYKSDDSIEGDAKFAVVMTVAEVFADYHQIYAEDFRNQK